MGHEPSTNSEPSRGVRFSLSHLMYAVTVIGVWTVAFGAGGFVIGLGVAAALAYVYARREYAAEVAGCILVMASASALLHGCSSLGDQYKRPHGAQRTCMLGNMRQLTTALQSYRQANGRFPPPYIADANGRPLHSWRVLITPYLESQDFYKAYDFAQPWDSKHNLQIARQYDRPSGIFHCPAERNGAASYFAITGPRTMWAAGSPASPPDGDELTLLLVEAHGRDVFWTEPVDLTADEFIEIVSATDRLGPHYGHVTNAYTADGASLKIEQGTSPEDLAAMIDPSDGIAVSRLAKLEPKVADLTVEYPAHGPYWWLARFFLTTPLLILVVTVAPLYWARRAVR